MRGIVQREHCDTDRALCYRVLFCARAAMASGVLNESEDNMSNHAVLDTTCPNNHNLTVTFTEHEFEDSLKSDTLVFHCNTCEANWPPTSEEIKKMREVFAGSSA
jgi:hypothetical protein